MCPRNETKIHEIGWNIPVIDTLKKYGVQEV